MSNARYFANGVDFWRVRYDSGNTEGPYISPVSARKVGNQGIKVRQTWSYGGMTPRVLLKEWQYETGFQLQKLGIVRNECDGSLTACTPGLCFGGHGSRLDWEDWSA